VADQPMIAPWWADVDTRGGGQPTNNSICFHIEPNRIVVTWHNVGYFSSHNNRLNDFQMVPHLEHLHHPATSTWSFATTAASGPPATPPAAWDGFGGTPAQVGFDAGNRMNYVALPMSRTRRSSTCAAPPTCPAAARALPLPDRGGDVGGGCTGAGMPCTGPRPDGRLRQGVTICAGMGTTCQQVNMPRARACNGFDNDCDGMPSTTATTSARPTRCATAASASTAASPSSAASPAAPAPTAAPASRPRAST
jgi:hypothetical protein